MSSEKPEVQTAQNQFNAQSLREMILKKEDIYTELVNVPEWNEVNGHLYVRSLSALEREQYQQSIRKTVGKGKNQTVEIVIENASAKLAALCACDKDGVRCFTREDIVALSKKNAKALERIVDHAAKMNGLTDDAEEQAGNASAETTGSASS